MSGAYLTEIIKEWHSTCKAVRTDVQADAEIRLAFFPHASVRCFMRPLARGAFQSFPFWLHGISGLRNATGQARGPANTGQCAKPVLVSARTRRLTSGLRAVSVLERGEANRGESTRQSVLKCTKIPEAEHRRSGTLVPVNEAMVRHSGLGSGCNLLAKGRPHTNVNVCGSLQSCCVLVRGRSCCSA